MSKKKIFLLGILEESFSFLYLEDMLHVGLQEICSVDLFTAFRDTSAFCAGRKADNGHF